MELTKLRQEDRNHVWGYVARNITRPLWLSRKGSDIDLVIGNPPWLSFRYMSADMKRRVRKGMKDFDIWVGGKMATQQDLSAYFFARCAEQYLQLGKRIVFLMPLAAMTRGQFEKFRSGGVHGSNVAFTEAWTFDERVYPLFPVPSCALFAERTNSPGRLPKKVLGFAGILEQRNATLVEAEQRLICDFEDPPAEASFQAATPYRSAFHNGATLYPRMLCYVERRSTGRVGTGDRIPISSRRSSRDKKPWKDVDSLSGSVEREFLIPTALNIALCEPTL